MSMPDNVLYIFQEIMMNIYEKECFVSNNQSLKSRYIYFSFSRVEEMGINELGNDVFIE